MELKFVQAQNLKTTVDTPIAPLWNWNWIIVYYLIKGRTLQSHLYGIEISLQNVIERLDTALQSHLYGIEITRLYGE